MIKKPKNKIKYEVGDIWLATTLPTQNQFNILITSITKTKFINMDFQHIQAYNVSNNDTFSIYHNVQKSDIEYVYCSLDGTIENSNYKKIIFVEKLS